MKKKTITGKVTHQKIEGGFWGIVDAQGGQWMVVNMPEQIKYPGKEVRVVVHVMDDQVGFAMWGTPVRIVSFHTMTP